jgi:phospho-N-acetylmuramoyl-pentapeptide-transferase
MGGIFFIGGITVCVIIAAVFCVLDGGNGLKELVINYLFMLSCGLIGIIDDRTKFVKKQNAGLTAGQKLVLQFLTAGLYVFFLNFGNKTDTSLALPFTETRLELSFFYYVFVIVGIVFTVNAANLTDGIDGLAASVTAVATAFLGAVAFKTENETVLVLASAIVGGAVGFLVYNFYPARVFMGDTGSLFFGGAVSALAMWLDMPLLLVFVGMIFYIEAFSVMLQVMSFKLFKKRIFKMSPIHHHFEMCGWNEIKIVVVFSLVTLVLSAIGSYGFLMSAAV